VRRVLLEKRVITLDCRNAAAPPQRDANLVRAKRRVDMDDIPRSFGQVADGIREGIARAEAGAVVLLEFITAPLRHRIASAAVFAS